MGHLEGVSEVIDVSMRFENPQASNLILQMCALLYKITVDSLMRAYQHGRHVLTAASRVDSCAEPGARDT